MSAGASIGISSQAIKVSDFEGSFVGLSAEGGALGIGGGFSNISHTSDGRFIDTSGLSFGYGIGLGASLDLGYQNVVGEKFERYDIHGNDVCKRYRVWMQFKGKGCPETFPK